MREINTSDPSEIERIRKICNHEIGHYVVAKELSFITHGITITIQEGGHLGMAIIEPRTPGLIDLENIISYLERRTQVLFAGVIAEGMDIDGNPNCEYSSKQLAFGGGANDHAKIRELIQLLRNIKHPITIDESNSQSELDNINESLINKAGELVKNNINKIYRLANILSARIQYYDTNYELSEDEICNVFSISE